MTETRESSPILYDSVENFAGISQNNEAEVRRIHGVENGRSFKDFIEKVLKEGLGLADIDVMNIYDQMMVKFDDNAKFQIMGDVKLNNLISNDIEIRKLGEQGGPLFEILQNDEDLKNKWNTFKLNIAKLQGLVILRHVEKGSNCGPIIKTLIDAFSDKINTVNLILEENLANPIVKSQTGGSTDKYRQKYWKYRFKYELLKKRKENDV